MDTDAAIAKDYSRYEKKMWGGSNRGLEMKELVDDFLDDRDNFQKVIECDVDMANGFLQTMYMAVATNRPEALVTFAMGWKTHCDEVAERIIRRK